MNEENSVSSRFKTISSQKKLLNPKNSTLRQLQLNMLNSLSKSPIIKIKSKFC